MSDDVEGTGEEGNLLMVLTPEGDLLVVLEEEGELTEDQEEFLLKVSCVQDPSVVLLVVLWIETTTHKVVEYITDLIKRRDR